MSKLQGAGQSLTAHPDAPYPWRLGKESASDTRWVVSDDGVHQALAHDTIVAEAIIKHVNAYPELVKALGVGLQELEHASSNAGTRAEVAGQLRAVLGKVEPREQSGGAVHNKEERNAQDPE